MICCCQFQVKSFRRPRCTPRRYMLDQFHPLLLSRDDRESVRPSVGERFEAAAPLSAPVTRQRCCCHRRAPPRMGPGSQATTRRQTACPRSPTTARLESFVVRSQSWSASGHTLSATGLRSRWPTTRRTSRSPTCASHSRSARSRCRGTTAGSPPSPSTSASLEPLLSSRLPGSLRLPQCAPTSRNTNGFVRPSARRLAWRAFGLAAPRL